MDQRPPRPPPPEKKGTVTSLASVFPPEEAQKASQRVHDTLGDRQKQLDQLQDFAADNASLINLVQRLPDELQHHIMVPFGKAAFFPGKLIHTNEFLVLLGEGYYADRTSKQTVDILKRRGKDLETQVDAVKAEMDDLKAEASFFDSTAAEAAEGLVEIREDYIEDASPLEGSAAGVRESDSHTYPEPGNKPAAVEDEEYNRILSRLAELEKEEEEAEKDDKDEYEEPKYDFDHGKSLHTTDEEVRSSEVHHLSNRVESQVTLKDHSEEDYRDQLHVEGQTRALSRDVPSQDKRLASSEPNITKGMKLAEVKESVQASLPTKQEVSVEKSESSATSSKAFTGIIVERTHNLAVNAANQKTVGHNSKPVSRFKMQRK